MIGNLEYSFGQRMGNIPSISIGFIEFEVYLYFQVCRATHG